MVQILLDECLPVKLKYRFSEAQRRFDVFITIDKSLSYQQKISTFSITVILLEAKSNRYKDLIKFVDPVSKAIKSAEKGGLYKISAESL